MLEKLIMIENGETLQASDFNDLVRALIDDKYYEMSEDQKNHILNIKAMANCFNTNITIVKDFSPNDIENKFIIKDEYTFILSILIHTDLILYEQIDANIFLKNKDKSGITDNYILVNKYAKELLVEYLK